MGVGFTSGGTYAGQLGTWGGGTLLALRDKDSSYGVILSNDGTGTTTLGAPGGTNIGIASAGGITINGVVQSLRINPTLGQIFCQVFRFSPTSNGAVAFQSTAGNNNITLNTGTGAIICVSLTETSTSKAKTNIEEYKVNQDLLLSLSPVKYKMKSKELSSREYVGLLAEDVHRAGFDELLEFSEDGSPASLDYTRIGALLLPIVKDLKEEIKNLKERLNTYDDN